MPQPIGSRVIDGDELLAAMTRRKTPRRIIESVSRWLRRQPRQQRLVSRQGAAEMLGISSPHLTRFADRLPAPVEIEGSSWKAYPAAMIEVLARELAAERAEKKEED